jgi:uncharacterized membrane protein (UPF0127 family)
MVLNYAKLTSMSFLGRFLAAFLLVFLAACGRDAQSPPDPASSVISAPVDTCGEDPPPTRPDFGRGTALIEHGEDSVIVNVEVAETDEQRQFGLMFEEELESDSGMVFIFFEEHTGGFYMKNTFLPLSIAYFDVDGKIVKIVDMDPCITDSTLYDPGAPYQGALEVNQGKFEEWGVSKGDVINIIPASPGL